MTNTNNQQFKSLDSIEFVRDITPETAANYSGGAVAVTDVTLTSQECGQGMSFNSNKGIEDLRDFGFNNATQHIAVNNDKTWRFYEHANFQGRHIDVGPNQAGNVGDFGMEISSFKSVS